MAQFSFALFRDPVSLVFAGGAIEDSAFQQALFQQGGKKICFKLCPVGSAKNAHQGHNTLWLKAMLEDFSLYGFSLSSWSYPGPILVQSWP